MKTNILLITIIIGVFITFSRSNAQQTLLTPTVQIDKTANKLCFGTTFQLTCTYTHANGVLWWKSPQSDGTILGNVNDTLIGYAPGPKDVQKLYFCIYVRTTHSDTTTPAVDSIKPLISATPVPQFEAFPKEGCISLTVDFRDSTTISIGSIATWNWDFGDGQTSTAQNPQHIYLQAGSYTVKLKTISFAGCENTTPPKVNYINAYMVPDVRYFASLSAPRTVKFQDSTKYASGASEWFWNFGDGGFSIDQNPQYLYLVSGTYKVKLQVVNEHNCIDSASKIITVTDNSLELQDYLINGKTIIYPNPVKDRLVVLPCRDEAVFMLLDIHGKIIMKIDNRNKRTLVIDMSALKPGIYILNVKHINGEIEYFKIIYE